MGDRVSVTLTVPTEYAEAIKRIYRDERFEDDFSQSDELCCFEFEEVNYGDLPKLDQLKDLGIAYDSEWGKGGNFAEGSKHLRFDIHGVYIEAETDAFSDYIWAESIGKILKGASSMVFKFTAISEIYTKHMEREKNLSWENQVEFGKLYRVNKLISPT